MRTNFIYTEISTAANTGLAKVAVQFSADTFVVNQSLILRINNCGEKPPSPSPKPLAVIVNNDIRQMNKLTTSLFSELNCN